MNKIDAVKMVREIRENQYMEIKNKNDEEIITYFKQKSREFRELHKKMAGEHK